MEFSVILNYVLGGGLLAALVGIVTLKATIRKAEAEADKAKAEAETVRIDNAEHATRILMENIVQPLKKELNETRELLQETRQELEATKKELGSTKREIARFRKAYESANSCNHSDNCPVLYKLRSTKDEQSSGSRSSSSSKRQPTARSAIGGTCDDTEVGGESEFAP